MSHYTPKEKEEAFKSVCSRIVAGEALSKILAEPNTPSTQTFYKWLNESEEMAKDYARATDIRADVLFERMMDIAATPDPGETVTTKTVTTKVGDKGREVKKMKADRLGHRRLQVDTIKWAISKLKPKKYGDKLDITSDNEKLQQSVVILPPNKREEDDYGDLM